jgi:hypothetical protein
MRRFLNLRSLFAFAVVAGGLAFTNAATAAGYGHAGVPHCTWRTVVVWQTIEEPVIDWVIRYDHCGRPYREKVVTYRTVRVPVEKLVKVCS